MKTSVLSLADLESFDSRARRGKRETGFLCPECGNNKPRDDAHRSLALNTPNGVYFCHRCGVKGVIKENWTNQPFKSRKARAATALSQAFSVTHVIGAPERTESVASLDNVKNSTSSIVGTVGQRYIENRAIPAALAVKSGVLFSHDFYGREAVIFPMHNESGELIAYNGRFTDGRELEGKLKTQTVGKKSFGLFITPSALKVSTVAVCEGVFDALSLHHCGLPSVAVVGTSYPEWLPRMFASKKVLVATDNDKSGDAAADKLIEQLRAFGGRVARLRSGNYKDWNDALINEGYGYVSFNVRQEIAAAFDINEQPKFINVLNEFIERGTVFDVNINAYFVKNDEMLSNFDRRFLIQYADKVLCILQQALLTKEIFNPEPILLKDYRFEISEREILMSGNAEEIPNEIHEKAVIEVTKSWFAAIFKEYL